MQGVDCRAVAIGARLALQVDVDDARVDDLELTANECQSPLKNQVGRFRLADLGAHADGAAVVAAFQMAEVEVFIATFAFLQDYRAIDRAGQERKQSAHGAAVGVEALDFAAGHLHEVRHQRGLAHAGAAGDLEDGVGGLQLADALRVECARPPRQGDQPLGAERGDEQVEPFRGLVGVLHGGSPSGWVAQALPRLGGWVSGLQPAGRRGRCCRGRTGRQQPGR